MKKAYKRGIGEVELIEQSDLPARPEVESMKAKIVNYMKDNGRSGFSCVNLEKIDGFRSESEGVFWSAGYTVFWVNMSLAAHEAMIELIQEDVIIVGFAHPAIYLIDGRGLTFPVAKSIKTEYKTPHWLPLEFRLA